VVASTKDLKPANFKCVKRMGNFPLLQCHQEKEPDFNKA
jgi:hypothetical protein